METAGDCYARYRVRMVEFRESIKIVRQALDGLPEGPISSRPGVKSVGQVRVPKGEGYARVEGARGEVGCYLVADGGAKPYRMKWRGRLLLEPRRSSRTSFPATRWPTWWRSWARSTPCSARSIGDAERSMRPRRR